MQGNQVLIYLGLIISIVQVTFEPVQGCGPGRAGGRRRMLRKYPPLVQRQYIPNVSENTLGASGRPEGPIKRHDKRFKQLVQNWNPDIEFRDEERTGADRMMTQRLKEKLSVLAISVMNQWPNVKLRVIEGLDEDNKHSLNSLHYEGRAVDITTSDKDKSKYGMLARLAVEAGFDWVHYESRSHVHCSVKSEKADSIRNNGCFDAGSLVQTPWGQMEMSQLQLNDQVLTMNPRTGQLQFSPVIMWLDRDQSGSELFVQLKTKAGRRIRLTSSHLIYLADELPRGDGQEIRKSHVDLSTSGKHLGLMAEQNSVDSSGAQRRNQTRNTYGGQLTLNEEANDSTKNNYYYYESIAPVDEQKLGTAQERRTNTRPRAIIGPVDELAFVTYSRNALVGQYLLVQKQAEQIHDKIIRDQDKKINQNQESFGERTASRVQFRSPSNNNNHVQIQSGGIIEGLEFDQITGVDFVSSDGIYAPLTREGNIVVNSVLASCYAVISDHDLAHMSFVPMRWFSYLNEWLCGGAPETPTEARTVDAIKSLNSNQITTTPINNASKVYMMNDQPVNQPQQRQSIQYVQARTNAQITRSIKVPQSEKNVRLTRILPKNEQQQQQSHKRHIHWYPILLYNIARYVLPLEYLY